MAQFDNSQDLPPVNTTDSPVDGVVVGNSKGGGDVKMAKSRHQHKMKLRHPDKAHGVDNPIPRKPEWIRIKKGIPDSPQYKETKKAVAKAKVATVCEEAGCPNIGECWSKKHATMMIMGGTCTRACTFCNVSTGRPENLSPFEPFNVAVGVFDLGLEHVVITSVDRDDLPDGGAGHFVEVLNAIREKNPNTTVELLTPDFRGKGDGVRTVAKARPDVYNHNLETVARFYTEICPQSRYYYSIRVLDMAKEVDASIFTKSGLMVGFGETEAEVLQAMDDLRAADVDFLTIGQYLPPSSKHQAVKEYVTPEKFKYYEQAAYKKGFLMVSASPLTRSSFHADADFARLKANRENQAERIAKRRILREQETQKHLKYLDHLDDDVVAMEITSVPRLQHQYGSTLNYFHTLKTLEQVKIDKEEYFTKVRLQIGLGETRAEVVQVLDDLKCANIDFVEISGAPHNMRAGAIMTDDLEYFAKMANARAFAKVHVAETPWHATHDRQSCAEQFDAMRDHRETREKRRQAVLAQMANLPKVAKV